MKKYGALVVVALLCAVGWAGATYVVGGKAESYYFYQLHEYGQWGGVTLTNQSYERGLLRSRAETLVEMAIPKSDCEDGQDPTEETVSLLFEHTLYHGPIPFGRDLEGQSSFSPALALIETKLIRFSPGDEELQKLLSEIPELTNSVAFTRIAFDGRTKGKLHVPAFEKQQEDTQISSGGFTVTADYDPNDKTLVGMIDMPKIQLRVADGEMSWNGVSGNFDLIEALPLVYVGTSKVVFGALDMTVPGEDGEAGEVVQMKEFVVTSDSSSDGKLVHYNQSMTFEGILIDGETYGPLIVDLEAKKLDALALSNMQEQIQNIYLGADNFDPDELAAQVIPMYSDLFMKLLAGSPELNISRLHVVTPMGQADGTFQMKFSGEEGTPLENPFALLQQLKHLDSSADIAVDESLLRSFVVSNLRRDLQAARDGGTPVALSDKEIDMLAEQQLGSQLDMLMAQNFVVRDGEKIKSSATFNRGELVVNGQPISLPLGL